MSIFFIGITFYCTKNDEGDKQIILIISLTFGEISRAEVYHYIKPVHRKYDDVQSIKKGIVLDSKGNFDGVDQRIIENKDSYQNIPN